MHFDGHRDVFTKPTFKGVVALAVSFFRIASVCPPRTGPIQGLTMLQVKRLVTWDEPYILLNFLWGWQSIFQVCITGGLRPFPKSTSCPFLPQL